jgi:hypothetical protein
MEYFLEIGPGIISAFALLFGIRSYAVLDDSSKIVLLIIAAGLLFELPYICLSSYDSYVLVNTCIAVHFLLVCIYFNHTVDVFIRSNTGFKIGIAGLLLGAGTAAHIPGHYVSLTESLCVIAMCLIALYRLLAAHDQLRLLRYHHFWFIALFLFYWSATYFINSFFIYDFLLPAGYTLSAGQSMKLISLLTYGGAGCIFLLYKKKFTVHE